MVVARLCSVVGLSVLVLVTSACASVPKVIYTQDEIVSEMRTRVSADMRDKIVIPFEIDDEIRQLAHDITKGIVDERQKAKAIIEAIIGLTDFSISYDWLSNKTAKEVFRQGKGNCLAYTNLFVGMAREVGLAAVYVDVESIERYTMEAEVIVSQGHVTAGFTEGPNVLVYDFTRTPEREYIGFRIIDDLEAIANFYNNQGFLYGYFTETDGSQSDFDPMEEELEGYRLALQVLPTFKRALNNLGVALRRRGRVPEAIEQYKKAIELDRGFAAAHANLARAYIAIGRLDDAVEELRIAVSESGPTGYFSQGLGVLLYQLKRYDEAIEQFKKALSKTSDLPDARYFLGMCYLQLGDSAKAIEELRAALEIDPNNAPARTTLDQLTGQDGGRGGE